MPVALEFDPDLVLVSAGFDPALGCPEGEQEESSNTFCKNVILGVHKKTWL